MVALANFMLKISQTVAGRSKALANYFLNLAKGIAHKDGAKLAIELPDGEGPITYQYETSDDNNSRAWDNFYANAGLFIRGYAEEIELDGEQLRENRVKLTNVAMIEPVFKANLARQLWGFAIGKSKQEQISYLILGGIAIVILIMVM